VSGGGGENPRPYTGLGLTITSPEILFVAWHSLPVELQGCMLKNSMRSVGMSSVGGRCAALPEAPTLMLLVYVSTSSTY
jgi:hypothetical protein